MSIAIRVTLNDGHPPVRDSNKDAFGLTDTYWFLGRVEYKAHRGSQPMSIEWVLDNPIPPGVWLSAGKMAVG